MRTDLSRAAELYDEAEPRGEYVIVIEGGDGKSLTAGSENETLSALTPEEHVAHYENAGKKRMDAIKAAAADRGMSKSELYAILNERKNND